VAAAGNDMEVQFNTGGALDGDSNFVWDGGSLLVGNGVDNSSEVSGGSMSVYNAAGNEIDLTAQGSYPNGPYIDIRNTGVGGPGVGNIRLANALTITWSNASYNASYNLSVTADNILLTTATIFQITPAATPPNACAAGTEGAVYSDTSHAYCWCDGTTWTKIAGAGTCA
jgi:hypothetical protein